MKKLRPFIGPGVVFLLAAAATAALQMLPFPWPGWRLASCYPGCFCETFHSGGVVQPQSSYSNLFYILAGLLILGAGGLTGREPRSNLMTRRRRYVAGFGWAAVAIGITSLFFHVSLTRVGRWLDYMGMYAFTAYSLLYSLARLRRWNGTAFLSLYGLLLAELGALWFLAPGYRRPLLGTLILGIVAVEAAAHRLRRPMRIRTRYLTAALGCFLAAYAVNMLDESGLICRPDGLLQWHAAWHFLTAASTMLLFLYYRSEDEEEVAEGRN